MEKAADRNGRRTARPGAAVRGFRMAQRAVRCRVAAASEMENRMDVAGAARPRQWGA
ncbi:hypothetical protein AZ22_2501 [Bordetella bronchiseptica 980-2]|nr:hypothetical protein AZ22_2501 [Bordetella bronchiseptica 980-2]KCV53422.1 hypothetical protein L491_2349 [Bordetella bronchiseptica 3E44]KCV58980.1 hypothetical protein AZ14_2409 [Bordetella bronchiseptica 980]KDB60566.1 hypothetical protein AZ16_2297 [Bordetella bronchiseptica B18-5 (C3)]KDB65222.1 hypothetical protein AZ15_2538 [Bordetella bronchiseptica A1-7]KDB72940.1 hypothetical protein AZ21_2418 [Bordetella bronchiseptica B20-10725633]KDB79413.1 hypothetical protein L495_3006 [Bord